MFDDVSKQARKTILAIALALATTPALAEEPYVLLDQGSQGILSDMPATYRIDSAEAFEQAIQKTGIGIEPTRYDDLADDRVLLLTVAGAQPSGGYSVYPEYSAANGTLHCRLNRPPKDAAVIMVITRPWMLIGVAREHMKEIDVIDCPGAPDATRR